MSGKTEPTGGRTYGVNVWLDGAQRPTTYIFPTEDSRAGFIASVGDDVRTASFAIVMSLAVTKAYYRLHLPSDAERTAWSKIIEL